jgi:subtilisin family serine protease
VKQEIVKVAGTVIAPADHEIICVRTMLTSCRYYAIGMLFALSVSAGEAATPRVIINASAAAPARYLVVLNDNETVPSVADELTARHGGRVSHLFRRSLHGFVVEASESAALGIVSDPRVKYVEQDSTIAGGSTSMQPVSLATQNAPPWGLDRIDQRDLPLDQRYTYSTTGAGVTAYITDSGINASHVEFGGRVRTGYNFSTTLPPDDCNGHGTHVAGIVGSSLHGVAKSVNLVSIRVLDCANRGFITDMVAGIDWAIADHQSGQPAVMNVSIYTDSPSVSFDSAIAAAVSDGITVCVLAGNGTGNNGVATDACSISPARVTSAITVSATGMNDTRFSGANFGSCVDLFAPGAQIESTWFSGNTDVALDTGTSMATAFATGAAALFVQDHPTASPATVASALIASASLSKVGDAGAGTPNRLLFTGEIDAPLRHRAAKPR